MILAPVQSTAVVVDPTVMDRLTALRQTLAPGLTDGELELFALVAQRKGLDPFSGQIMAVKRNTNRGSRVTYQTGIDGYRSIAERTNQYLGSDDADFGPECDCGAQPPGHPRWARVTVRRWHQASGQVVAQPGTADWHEFVPSEDFMWRSKPRLMIAKCAEAQALRKAFPWVLGDLYIPEEMARDEEPASAGPRLSPREAVAAKVAALQDADAEDPAGQQPEGTVAADPPEPEPSIEDEPMDSSQAQMSPEAFRDRVTARGIGREQVMKAAQRLFPGRPATALEPTDWAVLYADLVPDDA